MKEPMALAGFVVGFADFRLSLPLYDAAAVISERVFGGIRFVEKKEDDECDIPTLRLEHDFAGIGAELIGSDDSYTIEICTRPSASVAETPDVCDLSAMLKQQLARVPGVILMPPIF